jgi:hypothetical protein
MDLHPPRRSGRTRHDGVMDDLEIVIRESVIRCLSAELGERGLLLTADQIAAAQADAARDGARLWALVAHGRAPVTISDGTTLGFDVLRDANASRLDASLAFGAAVAALLTPDPPVRVAVETVCAIFNLGAGVVDGVCDRNPAAGVRLLEVAQAGIADAVSTRCRSDWLQARIPRELSNDLLVGFTAAVVEALVDAVHAAYPQDDAARRRAGRALEAALEVEYRSIGWSTMNVPLAQLTDWSRMTSVLPFQIIHVLVGGEPIGEPSAATLLGEATWLIDDLVDLLQDARTGALNAVLLAAVGRAGLPNWPASRPEILETLVDSDDLADAAARAAECLASGLQLAGDGRERSARSFVHFLQRYVGIPA